MSDGLYNLIVFDIFDNTVSLKFDFILWTSDFMA